MANVYSNARNSFYAISGYPTYFFDGVLSVVGGSGTSSMYSSYVPKVTARNAIPSDFTIGIEFEATDADYNATVTIENVGGNTMSNLVLQFVLTESKLPIVWGLTQEQDFTNRLMVPDQFGTALDFSGSSTQVVDLSFTTASHWDIDNCELIAFVQNNTTKEVLQGTKEYMAVPLYNIDAQAKEIKYPTGEFCGSSLAPVVLIKNMGGDDLTSLDIEYSINGGAVETYAWTGELGFNLGEEVTLPEISFTPEALNTIDLSVSNPNGQIDPNPENDDLSHSFDAAPQITTGIVEFELKTDNYPSETTWEVKNSEGTVLYSGGPYSGQANTIFNETWELSDEDCYTFTIYDVYGDGICCTYGQGYYKIMDASNTVIIEGGQFGSEETKPFERFGDVMTANFTAATTSIVEGESVSFTDLSSGEITIWYWEFEGGTPATSSAQNPTVMYSLEGMYDVTLTVSDGSSTASKTMEDYITVDHITGMGTNQLDAVSVFPNPTTGLIYISGTNNAQVKVYNNTGSIVKEIKQLNTGSIDLSELDNGIYFIQIAGADNTVVSRKINLLK